MASYKTNRTEEDILREMTAILRELKDPRIDPMLTVTFDLENTGRAVPGSLGL